MAPTGFDTLLGMRIAEAFVPEFDQEMANVRKTLERIPDAQWDWQPHSKSMNLGKLANHIADIPSWTLMAFDRDTFDLGEFKNPDTTTTKELLALFDENQAKAHAVLSEVPDELASGMWSLTGHGATYFTIPKTAVIRTWVLNHIIHHRAQMGVYLRLLDIPVPGVYGPSADEM